MTLSLFWGFDQGLKLHKDGMVEFVYEKRPFDRGPRAPSFFCRFLDGFRVSGLGFRVQGHFGVLALWGASLGL